MKWISGVRGTQIYTVTQRPLDPRWSKRDLQMALSWCAVGQHLGWNDGRAFQAAEAMVMERKHEGIVWPQSALTDDMEMLKSAARLSVPREEHETQEH